MRGCSSPISAAASSCSCVGRVDRVPSCSGWMASSSRSSASAASSRTTCCSDFRSRPSCWATPRCPSCRWSSCFNSLLLWTLVTVSIEWARTRHVSLAGFAVTVKNVATNPVVGSILIGTAWGWLGIPLPTMADRTLELDRPGGDPAVADRAGDGPRRVRRPRGLARKHGHLRGQAHAASARGLRAGPRRSACRRSRRARSCCWHRCRSARTSI